MADIKFTREQTDALSHKLKSYLADELDCEAGQFECEFLLDFIAKEIGPYFYYQGLQDAGTVINEKFADINDALYELEPPINLR